MSGVSIFQTGALPAPDAQRDGLGAGIRSMTRTDEIAASAADPSRHSAVLFGVDWGALSPAEDLLVWRLRAKGAEWLYVARRIIRARRAELTATRTALRRARIRQSVAAFMDGRA